MQTFTKAQVETIAHDLAVRYAVQGTKTPVISSIVDLVKDYTTTYNFVIEEMAKYNSSPETYKVP